MNWEHLLLSLSEQIMWRIQACIDSPDDARRDYYLVVPGGEGDSPLSCCGGSGET